MLRQISWRDVLFISVFVISICWTTGLKCWECENVRSQEECLEKGNMTECDETQNTCQVELRHGGWGEYPLIEKACKQLTACGSNHMQDSGAASVYNRDSQCNKKAPSSVCRCCCNTDGCNHDILYCKTLGGLPCPAVEAPENGFMKCEGGMKPFGVCTFSCKRGFALVGSPVSTCDVWSKRDHPAPTCQRYICRELLPQYFGTKFCTDGVNIGSRCRFTCNTGYRLHGGNNIICTEDRDDDQYALWSRPQPQCKPLQCTKQSLSNGRMQCTDRNFVASRCTFQCNKARGYVLYPEGSTSNECQVNELWTRPAPCCTLPCPPFAVMDFFVILDSSSSVGKENWKQMKKFVRDFLDEFTVREDSTHFAVIRYNKVVDNNTQIFLDDHPNSLENVLKAFDKIPYDGSGTRTGKALNYTAKNLIPKGNRPDARDVVLLITDGASQDDVIVPSKILRDTGALMFVLPVKPPVGRLDLDEINAIAGPTGTVIKDAIKGGFKALDEAFAARMRTKWFHRRQANIWKDDRQRIPLKVTHFA